MPVDTTLGAPAVDVITLNYNGRAHLDACFASLRALDYPGDRFRIVCVDNASSDGSADYIRSAHPDVALIESGANLGFAGGCNLGARASAAEYVAFVNNDARVDPGWLAALVDAVHGDAETVCAAAKILDWDGRRVDFVEGHVNFHGFARQVLWEAPVEPGLHDAPKPLLFACGGAMLIRRDVFLDVGGFDDDYFMFFEDVDLGWRLWLHGYRVVFAPAAVTYHRHHGTAGRLGAHRRNFLYERNALWTIVKNYDDANLARILPAAILLAAHRATDHLQRAAASGDDLAPDRWTALDWSELRRTISYGDLAPIVALRDVAARMPELLAKREAVQARRARPDAEILPLFGQPLRQYPQAHMLIQAYCDSHNRLVRAFGIDRVFEGVRRRVLILTSVGLPRLGFPETAEGRRAEALGRGLAALGHAVVYSQPKDLLDAIDRPIPAGDARYAWDDRTVDPRLLAYGPDVVVATHWRALAFVRLAVYRPVVLDYNPAPPDLVDAVPIVRKTVLARDYLANVDLFTAACDADLAAFREWLAGEPGLDVPSRHFRVVPGETGGDHGTVDVAALSDYCQRGWIGDGKLPIDYRPDVPRTPLLELPARAWETWRQRGPGRLWYDVRRYLTWRIDLVRRSLGV